MFSRRGAASEPQGLGIAGRTIFLGTLLPGPVAAA